jgi:phosphate transport system substrate-binding protein
MTRILCRLLTAIALLALGTQASAELRPREHILVVGSSTAYPMIAWAAEQFGRHSDFVAPVVESTGTGGGIKLFCNGLGLSTPDIAMASRPMKPVERERCHANRVNDVREIKIGFDGIVLASRRDSQPFRLKRDDLYRALARWVPDASGKRLIANPYKNWRQIDKALPDLPIRVYGPPPTSGTRDILVEHLLNDACLDYPMLQHLQQTDPEDFEQRCYALREDGGYVNGGENDARLVRKLLADGQALGIFGFNFLDRNRDRLQAATIDGHLPTFESIQTRRYPLSRPLYLYIKPRHYPVVPGLETFVDRLAAPRMIGPDGLLVDQGLIPLPDKSAQATVGHSNKWLD